MARCFNDTCSITVTEENIGDGNKFSPDVNLDPDGGIICTEGQGLGVDLYSILPDAVITSFEDAARTAINADADTTTPQFYTTPTHSFTNTFANERLVIVTGELLYQYAILGEGSAVTDADLLRCTDYQTSATTGSVIQRQVVPFNAQVTGIAQYAVGAAPSLTGRRLSFPVSGNMVTFEGSQEYQYQLERRQFSFPVAVAAGAILNVNSTWAYQGKDQTVNVIAYGSTVFANLGAYIKNGSFISIPVEVV